MFHENFGRSVAAVERIHKNVDLAAINVSNEGRKQLRIKGDDKESIDAKVQNLSEKAQVLAQKAQEKAGADGSAETGSADAGEDVVDADFEEVKEEK